MNGKLHSADLPANDRIRVRHAQPADAEALADVLIDCVEGGASVSFMHPLPRAKALGFWQEALASAERGERIVLVAEDASSAAIAGTVQIVLNAPENQPHCAEVAKTLVHRNARRRGVGEALMRAVETAARETGKTLLVLDTVTAAMVNGFTRALAGNAAVKFRIMRSGRAADCAARPCSIGA